MALLNLNEYNESKSKWHAKFNSTEPIPNGIACPKCNAEMMDSDPQTILTSNPPQKRIHCSKCDYSGLRIA